MVKIDARVQQKKDTEANWLANPIILLDGEQAFVVTGNDTPINFKIGDGTKTFAQLPYFVGYGLNVKAIDPSFVFTGQPAGVFLPDTNGTYNGVTVDLSAGLTYLVWDGNTLTKVVYPISFGELSNLLEEKPTNLILSLEDDSAWSSSSPASYVDFAGYKAANLVLVSPGDVIYFKGLTNATITGGLNLARMYDSGNSYLGNIPTSSIQSITGGHRVILPATVGLAKIGLFFPNADASVVKAYKGSFPEYKIRDQYLPPFLSPSEGVKSSDILDQDPVPENKITAILTGLFRNTTTTDINTGSSANGYSRTNVIQGATPGKWYAINTIGALTLSQGSIVKVYNSSGAYINQIIPSAFIAISGGYKFQIPSSFTGASQMGLNFTASEVPVSSTPNISLQEGEVLVIDSGKKLKPELIDQEALQEELVLSGFLKEDSLPEPKDVSAEMMLRGFEDPNITASKMYAYEMMGQSNADGRIPIAQAPSWFTDAGNTIPGVLLSNNNESNTSQNKDFTTFALSNQTRFGFDVFLNKLLLDYWRNKSGNASYNIYEFKHAKGGTSISTTAIVNDAYWTPYFERIPLNTDGTRKYALLKGAQVRWNLIIPTATYQLFDSRCVIWHQGESDKNDADNYYNNLKSLIAYTRGARKRPRLVFILCGINTFSVDYSEKVEAAKVKLAEEDPFIFYAPSDNLSTSLNSDMLHLNGVGGQNMAQTCFNIMKDFERVAGLRGGLI